MRRLSLFLANVLLMTIAYSCRNNSPKDNSPDNPNNLSVNMVNIPASASSSNPGKLPKIAFSDTTFDFGNITEGQKVSHAFHFKNVGQGDLIISGAGAGCSCTKPYYPKDVKHPGDTGTISVTFDTSNKSGKQVKTIKVTANTQPPMIFLTITSNIQPSNN